MTKRAGTGEDGKTGSGNPGPDFAGETARILAEQAAAFTVMTVYGMQMAGKMTGAMLGAWADMAARKGQQKAGDDPVAERPVEPQAPRAQAPEPVTPAVADKVVPMSPKPKAAARPAKARQSVAAVEAGPAGMDDLKRISGIGPRLERVLKDKGVATLAQIAAWSEADMTRIDTELGLENRVIRDDWAGQARALLEG